MSRTTDETERLEDANRVRHEVTAALAELDHQIVNFVRVITNGIPQFDAQQLVAALTDNELLGLHAWTGTSDSLAAECKRRAEAGSKFTAYLEGPTA